MTLSTHRNSAQVILDSIDFLAGSEEGLCGGKFQKQVSSAMNAEWEFTQHFVSFRQSE